MDIGVLGGTFDPIHIAHLIVAEEVRLRLRLDQVIFVPAGRPWLKGDKGISAPQHRLEMTRLAVTSNPYFQVSTIEVDRAGPSYTVDTIAAFKRQYGAGVNFYFILGLDALAKLHRWKEPMRLLEMCQLVSVNRPWFGRRTLEQLEAHLPGASERIRLVNIPRIDISGSAIRRRVEQGLSIRYLVPELVERYIKEQGLYI